jgi:hypothetical protein
VTGPATSSSTPRWAGLASGYDIDQTGNLPVAEALTGPGGADVAVETFDIRTGQIVDTVIQKLDSRSDFVTLGIVGSHIGLIEFEHVTHLFVDARRYFVMNPLNANRFTGRWTPPLTDDQIIPGSRHSGRPPRGTFDNGGTNRISVFSADVAATWSGDHADRSCSLHQPRPLSRSATISVLGTSNGCPNCPTKIATVDLTNGTVTSFRGLGLGYVNGIAVDPETGIACTATEIDFSVEFYDLAAKTGIIRRLPGASSQAQSGAAVQFDPVNKLFLVQQPMSSTAPSGSSIQVYDEQGNFVESINGLHLPVSPTTIACTPLSASATCS